MKIPENLKYSREHEWVKVDGDCAYIGITDFAQSELGDIVFVEFPEIEFLCMFKYLLESTCPRS